MGLGLGLGVGVGVGGQAGGTETGGKEVAVRVVGLGLREGGRKKEVRSEGGKQEGEGGT